MADRFVVHDTDGLSEALRAFRQAVRDGEGHLEIELPARCLGLDAPVPDLELVGEDASAPAPIDVTLRSRGGPCVLAGMGVRIAARSVRLEGIAVVAPPGAAVDVTAEHSVRLRDVIVLGTPATAAARSPVVLRSAGSAGTTAAVESSVIAQTATDSGLRLACGAGSWFHAIGLHGVTVQADGADALIGIDSVGELRLSGCRLAAGGARTVLRLLATAADGELAACQLSAAAGALVEIGLAFSPDPVPLRLTDGTAVTARLGELPLTLAADATVVEVAGETVDALVRADIAAARERVLAVDGGLGRLLGA